MFRDTLNSIISDLDNLSPIDSGDTLRSSVVDKLHTILDNYDRHLKLHRDALNKKDSLKVLRGFYR